MLHKCIIWKINYTLIPKKWDKFRLRFVLYFSMFCATENMFQFVQKNLFSFEKLFPFLNFVNSFLFSNRQNTFKPPPEVSRSRRRFFLPSLIFRTSQTSTNIFMKVIFLKYNFFENNFQQKNILSPIKQNIN